MERLDNTREIQLIELDILIEMDRICKENNLKYSLAYGSVLGAIRHKGFIPWDTDIDIIVDINNYDNFCNLIQKNLPDSYFLSSINTDGNYESLKARIGLKNELHHLVHIDIYPIVGTPKSDFGKKIFAKIAYLTYRAFFIKKVNPDINYKDNRYKRNMAYIAKMMLKVIPSNFFVYIFNKLGKAFPVESSDHIYNFCGLYGYKEYVPKKFFYETIPMKFENYEFPVPRDWNDYLTHLYGDYMTPRQT